jgi:hypothetical protein
LFDSLSSGEKGVIAAAAFLLLRGKLSAEGVASRRGASPEIVAYYLGVFHETRGEEEKAKSAFEKAAGMKRPFLEKVLAAAALKRMK